MIKFRHRDCEFYEAGSNPGRDLQSCGIEYWITSSLRFS